MYDDGFAMHGHGFRTLTAKEVFLPPVCGKLEFFYRCCFFFLPREKKGLPTLKIQKKLCCLFVQWKVLIPRVKPEIAFFRCEFCVFFSCRPIKKFSGEVCVVKW